MGRKKEKTGVRPPALRSSPPSAGHKDRQFIDIPGSGWCGFLVRGLVGGDGGNYGLGHLAIAAAGLRWLEGPARVEFAIGQTRYLLLATEVEVRELRVADGPTAVAFEKGLDRLALCQRDVEFLG